MGRLLRASRPFPASWSMLILCREQRGLLMYAICSFAKEQSEKMERLIGSSETGVLMMSGRLKSVGAGLTASPLHITKTLAEQLLHLASPAWDFSYTHSHHSQLLSLASGSCIPFCGVQGKYPTWFSSTVVRQHGTIPHVVIASLLAVMSNCCPCSSSSAGSTPSSTRRLSSHTSALTAPRASPTRPTWPSTSASIRGSNPTRAVTARRRSASSPTYSSTHGKGQGGWGPSLAPRAVSMHYFGAHTPSMQGGRGR